uniref:Uncharacterized protein n=1 Tax=Ananas comosus var. bracteatus TaxID=296719 RepID=A0A6V7PI14_ANACO|nr:unnamed protein product [Ananas comosus var. bracteatus]
MLEQLPKRGVCCSIKYKAKEPEGTKEHPAAWRRRGKVLGAGAKARVDCDSKAQGCAGVKARTLHLLRSFAFLDTNIILRLWVYSSPWSIDPVYGIESPSWEKCGSLNPWSWSPHDSRRNSRIFVAYERIHVATWAPPRSRRLYPE